MGDQQNQRGLPKLKPVANIGQGEWFPAIPLGNKLTAPIEIEKAGWIRKPGVRSCTCIVDDLSEFAQGREVELAYRSWIIGAHDERS